MDAAASWCACVFWQELGMPDYVAVVGDPIDLQSIARWGLKSALS